MKNGTKKQQPRPVRASVHRALRVQEIYQTEKKPGIPDVYIWRTHIYPAFGICLRTMQRDLERPAKRQLRELNQPVDKPLEGGE